MSPHVVHGIAPHCVMDLLRQVASIVSELDDLLLTHRFDVVALSNVESASRLDHIARGGKDLWVG